MHGEHRAVAHTPQSWEIFLEYKGLAFLPACSQVDDHKEVWLLDRHQREWCPGPDPAPLPPPGMFQLCMPRLALTWPQQAPQQQQQSVQWRAA
eukprot:1156664-Pelagomonas_calceolata.AAC.1